MPNRMSPLRNYYAPHVSLSKFYPLHVMDKAIGIVANQDAFKVYCFVREFYDPFSPHCDVIPLDDSLVSHLNDQSTIDGLVEHVSDLNRYTGFNASTRDISICLVPPISMDELHTMIGNNYLNLGIDPRTASYAKDIPEGTFRLWFGKQSQVTKDFSLSAILPRGEIIKRDIYETIDLTWEELMLLKITIKEVDILMENLTYVQIGKVIPEEFLI